MTPDEARILRCGNRVIFWRGFGFSYGNVEKVTDYGFEVLWDRSQQTSSYTFDSTPDRLRRTESIAPKPSDKSRRPKRSSRSSSRRSSARSARRDSRR